MMKYKAVFWFVTCAVWIGVATAQKSKPLSSSPKASPAPVHAATKPLTPKSAMPPPHKSSVVAPHASKSNQKSNAELNHLERQPIKATSPKKTAKSASAPKPAGATNANGSGINSTYQKPVPNKP